MAPTPTDGENRPAASTEQDAQAAACVVSEPRDDKPGNDHASRQYRQASGKILVLEDDYVIGQQLAAEPVDDGFAVSGPHASVGEALAALRADPDITLAILDLNLNGRIDFDLAEELVKRRIPFIFYTGYESAIVPEQFRRSVRVKKPARWRTIRKALQDACLLQDEDAIPDEPNLLVNRDFLALLPLLRQRAREITPHEGAAETLVERTLERAIEEIESCPSDAPVDRWLMSLLESTGIGEPSMLN